MEISIFEKGSIPFIDCSQINEQEVQNGFERKAKNLKVKFIFRIE